MSVFGRWFPHLLDLDFVWAESKIDHIFPSSCDSTEANWVAWESYLILNRPNLRTWRELQSFYELSVNCIPRTALIKTHLDNFEAKLGEHLIVLYWNAELPSAPEPSILTAYFDRITDGPASNLVETVVRIIHNTEKIPPGTIERLASFIQYRVSASEQDAEIGRSRELVAYLTWLSTGVFDQDFSIKAISDIRSTVGPRASFDRNDKPFIEYLGSIARAHPIPSLETIEWLVSADPRGWRISYWQDEAKTVIRESLASEQPGSADLARCVVDLLLARGFNEFRGLDRE
jgi:hypothetical protein